MSVKLHRIAHARTGDKGDASMISLIAYRASDYDLLQREVTAERVAAHFTTLALTQVERFELPQLAALNFVLHGSLDGGVTRSLALDAHGKTLGSCLLDLDIDIDPEAQSETGHPMRPPDRKG